MIFSYNMVDGGLSNVFVNLKILFDGQVEELILRKFTFWVLFCCGRPSSCLKVISRWVGGACVYGVGPCV